MLGDKGLGFKCRRNKSNNKYLQSMLLLCVLLAVSVTQGFKTASTHVFNNSDTMAPAGTRWLNNTDFDANLLVIYFPINTTAPILPPALYTCNITPYADPNETEAVEILLVSRYNQTIAKAAIDITFQLLTGTLHFKVDYLSSYNATLWYYYISPLWPAGTIVRFKITAIDPEGNDLISEEYSYTVQGDLPWLYPTVSSPTFEANIELNYTPQAPNSTESVSVVIRARNDSIYIRVAHICFPDESGSWDQPKGWLFDRINKSAMNTTIPPKLAGTEVQFKVRVWDKDDHPDQPLESPIYFYTVRYTPGVDVPWLYPSIDYPVFEDNVEVEFIPKNQTGEFDFTYKYPNASQSLEVRVKSKDWRVPIARVDLLEFEYYVGEEYPEFKMMYQNATRWYVTLPPRPGGYHVKFRIQVWDVRGTPLQSPLYHYVVRYTPQVDVPWKYKTFEENVILQYTPKRPNAYEPVYITVVSRDPSVPIVFVMLNISIISFDGKKSEGTVHRDYVVRTDPIRWNCTIPGEYNQPGATITFWIVAQDYNGTMMFSPKYNYTISIENATLPWLYPIWISVYDEDKQIYPRGAIITVWNETATWQYVTNGSLGIYTEYLPVGGVYTVKVEYNSAREVRLVTVSNNTVLYFNFSFAEEPRIYEFEPFPQWYVYLTFAVILLLGIPVFVYYYTKIGKRREKPVRKQK